ncbi:MAG: T9SS type A sorting domain-containing protein, partial [bacterium]|nr:T9SS type A sorting domain-containing protein [bacterium]
IPGQPLHTVISYYIKAKDLSGYIKTTPKYTFRVAPTHEFYTIICEAYNTFITTKDEIVTAKPCTLNYNNWDKEISFTIKAESPLGWSEVIVPWDLLHGSQALGRLTVKVDGGVPDSLSIEEFPCHYTKLYFTYEEGEHSVNIWAPIRVGDIYEDGKIDGLDITTACRLFGNTPELAAALGLKWVPRADIDKNKKIDGRDITFICRYFGAGKLLDNAIIPEIPTLLNSKSNVPKGVIMSVKPETICAEQEGIAVGDSFKDSICVSGITNEHPLYSYEVLITFDTTVLEVHPNNVKEGPFLSSVGPTTWACAEDPFGIKNAIAFTATLIGESSGATGSGTLAYITWKVVGAHDSPIEISNPDTWLLDTGMVAIPFDTVDGYFKWSSAGVEEVSMGKINELLLQSYPNPFGLSTVINYQLPSANRVSLRIYDISGRLIETLVDEAKKAGCYSATWDTKVVNNGIYFCRLECAGKVLTQKLVLVK